MQSHGAGPTAPTTPPSPGEPAPAQDVPGDHDPASSRRSGLAWGLALIAAGVLWLLWLSGVAIPWGLVLPLTLIAVGALVLARPRAEGGGLIGLGIVVMILGLAQPGLPITSSFTAGERSHTITDVTDLDDTYALGAGSLVLDLRDLDLGPGPADGPVELSARVTFGELIVRVPEHVRVRGAARVAFGEVAHFGRADGGVNPRAVFDEAATSGDARDDDVLELDLRVAFGQIEVRR